MRYYEEITLKDGRKCVLRNGTESDGEAALQSFILTHGETDYLRTYPDEITFTAEDESKFLAKKENSSNEIEILAVVDGRVVGTAGFEPVGTAFKTRHRADFGICVERAHWGLGIGRALTRACIKCAKQAGYICLELDAVADNESALSLYKSEGFVEYGRRPMGFNSRLTGRQDVVLMSMFLK